MGGPIAVTAVSTADELDRFIRLPMRLQKDDPNYIPPLVMERREALSPKTNPFFAHADVQLWLATQAGRDVGRISAQIDRLAPESLGRAGHFGMIAAEDDPDIFTALFAEAEAWLRARGRDRALGPFNLSINEEVGLLVEGRDTPPMVMMGHDPAYVAGRVEALGYAKAKDVYAYVAETDAQLPPRVLARVQRGAPDGVRLRELDLSRYDEEVRTLTHILNDAWADNWGFTPTTEAETAHLAKALRPVVDRRLTWFAEIDGEVAGFLVFLPNLNDAIADLDGRLAPFGWARLLWRLKVSGVKTARAPLMGVRRKFAGTPRGMVTPFLLIHAASQAARRLGYRRVELSWILEDNRPMRRILEAAGARPYKTYRIYEKAL
jgi:GNAT superfamily N-acetyltransferase